MMGTGMLNKINAYKIGICFLLFITTGSSGAEATAALRDQLKKATRQKVTAVTDGDTVILEDNSRVRLVGLQAPKLPLGRKNHPPWPLAQESKRALEKLVLGQYVTLYYGGAERDRYGRALAHLFRDDGLWVQEEMLNHGMARVYSFADNRALVTEMLNREQQARRRQDGIWALDFYAPRTPAEGLPQRNRFQLVQAIVRHVAKVRGTYYLNFGDDWKTDFTIVIKSPAARLFHKTGHAPESYKNKKIEIRGWLKTYNGPMIEASHPEQIMIIDERILHDPRKE
tara:strand:+ start:4871 stop:5722 length:852 start_codon:yes stop_codon:yes gene_type:complete